MRTLAPKFRNAEGAEIAEAALVLPVVFVFLLGIIWFGRAFNVYSTIQQAAQQGAIAAARPVCATCTTGDPFVSDTTVTKAISTVMQASSLNDPIPLNSNPPKPVFCLDPVTQKAWGKCSTTGNNITICREVALNSPPTGVTGAGVPADPICGTLVTFQYPFQFSLPFTSLNLSKVILTAQAQSRMEN